MRTFGGPPLAVCPRSVRDGRFLNPCAALSTRTRGRLTLPTRGVVFAVSIHDQFRRRQGCAYARSSRRRRNWQRAALRRRDAAVAEWRTVLKSAERLHGGGWLCSSVV